MPIIAEAIVIRAPLEAVFAYHSDPRTAVQWSSHVQAITDLSGDPRAVGTTWTVVGRIPPLPVPVEVRFRVLRSTPPSMICLEMSGVATATVTNRYIRLEASRTRLETRSEYAPPATFFGRAVDGVLVQRVLARDVHRSLRRLKSAIEAGGGGT